MCYACDWVEIVNSLEVAISRVLIKFKMELMNYLKVLKQYSYVQWFSY